jgi:cellulose synthase/poly-beta-1,6-N-acetylglucosamine synthase-like glycosyltransferase
MTTASTALLALAIAFVCALMFVLAVSALTRMLDAWRTPASNDDGWVVHPDDRAASAAATEGLRFSLIVTAQGEQIVLAKTLASLVASDRPGLQVLVVVGDDDPMRAASANTWAARHSFIEVVADVRRPKSKAEALSSALPYCTGDVVGVLDAEDVVAPDLFGRLEEVFGAEGADVVQVGAQPMNFQSSWWAVSNCLDHFLGFRSRLRRRSRLGFVPLSGSSVFFRRTALEAVQGWDPSAVAEESDLGVRLASAGARTAVVCEPALATQEDGPAKLGSLFRERTRSDEGILQVLRRRDWRKLPTRRQRMLALRTLSTPLLRAGVAVMVPLVVIAAFGLSRPSVAIVLAFPVAAVLAMTVAAEVAALREFGQSFAVPVRFVDHVRLVLGFVPHQAVLTGAAMQAVWRNAPGRGESRKTRRANARPAGEVTLSTAHTDSDPAPTPGVLGRLGSWFGSHRWSLAVGLPAIALVGFVHAWGMYRSPGLSSDEATLTAQAWTLEHFGGFAHGISWWGHPPLGWIQIAGWTWFTGAFNRAPFAIAAGREAMLVATLVTASLLFVLCRRLGVRRGFAVLAVVLYGLSPLTVAFTRVVQLDNVAVPWLLGAFVLALSPRRSLVAAVASGLCFAVAVLSAGTTVFLVVPWAWLLWQHADRRNRGFVMAMALSASGVAVAFYAMFALLHGQLLPESSHTSLLQALNSQLLSRSPSGGVVDSTIAAQSILQQWRHFDPLLPVISVAAAVAGGFIVRLRPIVAAFAIQLVLLLAHGGHPTPAYVITILPFAAVLVAAVVESIAVRPATAVEVERPVPRTAAVRPATMGGVLVLILLAGTAVPAWGTSLHRQLTSSPASASSDATDWVVDHVSHDSRLVVDQTLWVDLVRAGFAPDHVIPYDALDQDPWVHESIGWRDIDGLVLPENLAPVGDQSTVRAALDHSELLASFGSEPNVVNIWWVNHEGTSQGATRPPGLATVGGNPGTSPALAVPAGPGSLVLGTVVTAGSHGLGGGLFSNLSTFFLDLLRLPFGRATATGGWVPAPLASVIAPTFPSASPAPPASVPGATVPPTTAPPTTATPPTEPPTTEPPTTEPPPTEPPTTVPPTTEPPPTEPPTTETPPTDPPPTDPPNPQFAPPF